MTLLTVRPLRAGDDDEIRSLFRSTLALGRSLPFELSVLGDYTALCLEWYLDAGRADAAVVEDGDRVAGYALVCTDNPAQQRWARREAIAFARRAMLAMTAGRLGAPARRFVRLRIRDGLALRTAPAPRPVHAHLNLDPSVRRTWAAPLLRDHIDAVCRAAGSPGWYGEVNAPVGRRAAALERLVGPVVHRAPNRTCSWLAGAPVERLTVVRDLGA